MIGTVSHLFLMMAGFLLQSKATDQASNSEVESSFFEGRWAFSNESCDVPTNWTMIAGGIFVSEDLSGNWNWEDGRLVLNLTDLAIDEETGEAGGRFQMEGPVAVQNADAFQYSIAPDVYEMKRCTDQRSK